MSVLDASTVLAQSNSGACEPPKDDFRILLSNSVRRCASATANRLIHCKENNAYKEKLLNKSGNHSGGYRRFADRIASNQTRDYYAYLAS